MTETSVKILLIKLFSMLTKNQQLEIIEELNKKIKTLNILKQKSNNMYQKILNINNIHVKDVNNTIEQYKKFAAWTIKFNLLKAAVSYLKHVPILVDLATGRGNDLKKWFDLKISRVIGIDIDPAQHKEAINRYRNSFYKQVKVSYILGSATDYNLVRRSLNYKTVNLITNNFAMNYFFKDQATIDIFFKTVSDSLTSGGLFIGTATDGDVITFLIKNNILKTQLFQIEPEGYNSYKFKLETPFFKSNESDESHFITEYIINKDTLVLNAKKFGLEPISIINGLEPIFNFTEDLNCNDNIYSIASLYFGFSFIKK